MFKWLSDLLGIGPKAEPVRTEVKVAAPPAPVAVVTPAKVEKPAKPAKAAPKAKSAPKAKAATKKSKA